VANTLGEIKNFKNNIDNTGLNIPFSIEELNEALSVLVDKSSPGPDGLSYLIFCKLPKKAKEMYLRLINLSWESGTCPQNWKITYVISILRLHEDNKNIDSYRLISLTNCIVKILERMIASRLRFYLESNNLINRIQAGFRKNYCTLDQAIRLKTEAENVVRSGNITTAVTLDFSKAFDLIWVDGLLLKMMRLNITGKILNWVKNYLTNRINQIKIGNSLSDPYNLDNGTPQGSVLSPLLFLIMINDFPIISSNSSSSLFADDSSLWRSRNNINQIIHHLQLDLILIEQWCNKWGFLINSTKSTAIIFSNKNTEKVPKL